MMKKIFLITLFFSALAGLSVKAQDQDPSRGLACGGIYDAIVKLNPVEFETPSLWRALEGDEFGFDQFRDVSQGPDGAVVAGGMTSTQDQKALSPFLMAFSSEGKTKWRYSVLTEQEQTIEALIRIGDQFVTIGNIKNDEDLKGLYLARFSMDGKLLSEKTIVDDVYDFHAMDIAASSEEGGVTILAWADNPADKADKYSLILQLDKANKQIRRRNYQPGPNNKLVSLNRISDGTYVSSGWIMQDDGRKAGWAVRLGDTGYLMWQQAYRRGKNAVLKNAVPHPSGGFVFVGESEPYKITRNEKMAAWGIWLGADGKPIWQRFWRSPYNMSGQDVITVDNNLIQVLVQADTLDAKKRDHAKILTLTLRGQLIEEEAFMEGGNTNGVALLKLPQQKRAIAGYAQTVFSLGDGNAETETGIYDAWLLLANAPEAFTDPCKQGAPANNPL